MTQYFQENIILCYKNQLQPEKTQTKIILVDSTGRRKS